MNDEQRARTGAGCAILALFNMLALCVLFWFALGAGMLVPMDCATERMHECAEGRAEEYARLGLALGITIAVNAAFAIWARWRRR